MTWSTPPLPDSGFNADPLAALEAFRKACKAQAKPYRPMYLLHYNEWVKAARGESFMFAGIECVIRDGVPVPKKWTERTGP